MDNWAYKVSVIVPVYNVERWLKGCVESLLAQTMPREEMEILLIDDGSPDGSGAICDAFAMLYPGTVKVWHKENEGAGPARNFGIRHAQGKYLMYLDSDDQLAPETVKACVDFFEVHYDEIDMVTYKDQPYINGGKGKLHYRYNYLNEDGIYDLNEYIYITQTRLNICIKNLGADSPMFHIKEMQEDQEYNTRILSKKMKIGYTSEGEYRYNKDNNESIMSIKFNSINLFEVAISWFEENFFQYGNIVPAYIQGLFVNDFNWKLLDNILLPYHYEKKEFHTAIARIKRLLWFVTEDTIMKHPQMDIFHKHYLISLKENSSIALISDDSNMNLVVNGTTIYKRGTMELVLTRCEVNNGALDFIAYLKSPIYNYLKEEAEIYVIENEGSAQKKRMNVSLANDSMYRCRTYTNRFFMFRYRCSPKDVKSFRFIVMVDGNECKTDYWFARTVPFNRAEKKFEFISNGIGISVRNGLFCLNQLSPLVSKKRIWLYSDAAHIKLDNAYYQFIHDIDKNDGITRYYITSLPLSEWSSLFSDAHIPYVVARNSIRHKDIYITAEKILTAYVNSNDLIASSPFTASEEHELKGEIHHEVIYLQHGVLHATYKQLYSLECNIAHKIVVSSQFEVDNFINKYHYNREDLILSGMARYDYIDSLSESKRKILFAPSWRGYFAVRGSNGEWLLKQKRLIDSNYYIGLNSFLGSPRLQELLETYDYTLDFKLHPIAAKAMDLFNYSGRVRVVNDIKVNEYSIFITDFSSFAFDFVYLKRTLFYFVPDYEEFRSGMNAYRTLDLEFGDAFGNLTITVDEALDELQRILERGGATEEVYRLRMERFFKYRDKANCERLYRQLTVQ